MSAPSTSSPVRTAAAWLAAAAGMAVATAAAAFPGGFAIPGISPDHIAALLPILLLPVAIHAFGSAVRWLPGRGGRWAQFARHYAGLPLSTRVAAGLLLLGAVVHLALLPGHLAMEPQTGILFAVDVAGFSGALVLALTTRWWRVPAGIVALLTVVAYAHYIQGGLEDRDLVGMATSAAELAVIPVALVGWVRQSWRMPTRRVLAVIVAGLVTVVSTSTVAHAAEGTSSLANALASLLPAPSDVSAMGGGTVPAPSNDTGAMSGSAMDNGNMSSGSGAGTAANGAMSGAVCAAVGAKPMANGMLMQPVPSTPPTPAQVAAANQLVAQTTAGIAPYANVNTAIAAGYTPSTRTDIPVVHMLNRRNFSDNPLANPAAPQSLVYAHAGNRWVLLGAMFMTNAICKQGPDIGGSLTDWHAHVNLCFNSGGTVTGSHPDASGQCPAGQTTHATPFMLHVYTVANNPQGPFELSNSAISQALRG